MGNQQPSPKQVKLWGAVQRLNVGGSLLGLRYSPSLLETVRVFERRDPAGSTTAYFCRETIRGWSHS